MSLLRPTQTIAVMCKGLGVVHSTGHGNFWIAINEWGTDLWPLFLQTSILWIVRVRQSRDWHLYANLWIHSSARSNSGIAAICFLNMGLFIDQIYIPPFQGVHPAQGGLQTIETFAKLFK